MECRLCKNELAERSVTLIDLGEQAYTGVFPLPGEVVPSDQLRVIKCSSCGLSQLDRRFDPDIMYGETYGYRSGLSKTMVNHLEALVIDTLNMRRAMNLPGLKAMDTVLDIGCSDGTLLSVYGQDVFKIGFDPVMKYMDMSHLMSMYSLYSKFFSSKTFAWLHDDTKPKIITAIAMFYDLDDPVKFLQDVKSVLHKDGIVCLELQFTPACVANNAVDIICHEHAVYYDGPSLLKVIRSAGLKLIDVSYNDINGGSVRVMLTHPDGIIEQIMEQILLQDGEISAYEWRRLYLDIAGVGAWIRDYCDQHGRIYALGASTKGNVLLQHWGLGTDYIKAIGEINPAKFGRVTPGTGIPIVNELEITGDTEATFLVLPWWLRDTFGIQYPELNLLFPLPTPVVVHPKGLEKDK